MQPRDLFENISPLDCRYYLANRDLFDSLGTYLSEAASISYCVKAEVALLKAHVKARGLDRPGLFEELDALSDSVAPEDVYAEEEKTKHNVRALVNVLSARVPKELAHLVHLGATSVDVLDTAQAARIRDAVKLVAMPLLGELALELCSLARREAETPQVGRTHGQHAVPITFGWTMAEYCSRLSKSIERIGELALDLRGKLAGAVGAYNALSMSYADPEAVEREYLAMMGLKPSDHSTQLVEPEHLLRLLLEMNVAFGVIANLADDLRNLQRTEIGEVKEGFASTQVGSSTMPHKRNPWNSEHVKSLWKEFFPRAMTFFMDQISEHQRDLTNSASQRFVPEFIAGLCAATNRMTQVVRSLSVDKDALARNLALQGGAVLAEPAYILLAESGRADAHELVRRLTLECERDGITLVDAIERDDELRETLFGALQRLGRGDGRRFFAEPARYRGLAAEKSRALADEGERRVKAALKRAAGD
jgi:adenylosuccinate lyase